MVTVSACTPPPDPVKRVGFLSGMIEVSEDFDGMGRDKILSMFEGG